MEVKIIGFRPAAPSQNPRYRGDESPAMVTVELPDQGKSATKPEATQLEVAICSHSSDGVVSPDQVKVIMMRCIRHAIEEHYFNTDLANIAAELINLPLEPQELTITIDGER